MNSGDYITKIRHKIGHDLLLLPSVAAVILDAEKKLLLQEKSANDWSLPAGMIEPGESPAKAVVREVKEETGLIVDPVQLLGVFSGSEYRHTYPNGDQVEYTILLFRCTVTSDTCNITDNETKSTGYFSKTSMPPLALPYPAEVLFNEIEAPFWHSPPH